MSEKEISVTLASSDVAWQLAQFCKRVGYDAAYELTEAHLPPDERRIRAYQMLAGIDAVSRGLAEAGIAPR